jgi:hypothetical protein
MSEVSIKKVVVKIGDKEIGLSLDEAKELQDILNRTFGTEKTVFVPSAPVIIERPWYPTYPHWYVTCEANTSGNYTITASNTAG